MYFLIDENRKIIIGWSAKCGCTHIKKIFKYFQNIKLDNIHNSKNDKNRLPNNIENYDLIIIGRNPFKRLISGFLDKYNINGEYRHLWKNDNIIFNDFVNLLIIKKWNLIEKHHFIPQTDEGFDKDIIYKAKSLKVFDLEEIDYNYIQKLFNKEIPNELINFKGDHVRKTYDKTFNMKVYSLEMNEYINYNVPFENFYNDHIKNQIYEFYKNDFLFFKENGIDYTDTLILSNIL